MLRIVTEQDGDLYTLSLHGNVAGEWVSLLDHYWRRIADPTPSARITVVLTDVSFIDAEGEYVLERMWRRGVEFVTSGCMNRYVIDKIRDQGRSVAGAEPRKASTRGALKRGHRE